MASHRRVSARGRSVHGVARVVGGDRGRRAARERAFGRALAGRGRDRGRRRAAGRPAARRTAAGRSRRLARMNDDRRLLLVHAHPDDEVIASGATMAKYAAEGAHVTLVTCTLGEEGEVLVPELAHLAADKE